MKNLLTLSILVVLVASSFSASALPKKQEQFTSHEQDLVALASYVA